MNFGASSVDSNGDKRVSRRIKGRANRASVARRSAERKRQRPTDDYTARVEAALPRSFPFSLLLAQLATCIGFVARPQVFRALLGCAARRGFRLPDAGGCRRVADLCADGQGARPPPPRAPAVPAPRGLVSPPRPRPRPVPPAAHRL